MLTLGALNAALQVSAAASPRARFEARLSSAQVDYVRAVSILIRRGPLKVANFFGTDTTLRGAAQVAPKPLDLQEERTMAGRILVLDDEENYAEMLQDLLREQNYQVDMATRAERAIDQLEQDSIRSRHFGL